MLIYKLFREDEWMAFDQAEETAGAPIDIEDGYIHFSTAEQVAETVMKHFAGESGIMLLAVEADDLEQLRWETSRDSLLFPHLYRNLLRSDIAWEKPLSHIGDFSELS